MRWVIAAAVLLVACEPVPPDEETLPHLELREDLRPTVLAGRATLSADATAVTLQLDLPHACRFVLVHTLVHQAFDGDRIVATPVAHSPELVTTPFDAEPGFACREHSAAARLGELELVTPWHATIRARLDARGTAAFSIAWPADADRAELAAQPWFVRAGGGTHAAYVRLQG